MKIVETGLKFTGTPKKRSATNRIIIHHSASGDVSASTIHGWHLNQKWMGIGYQFVIRADGTVERGRAEWSIGSHSGPGANGDSIGICLTGNFETGRPTEAQIAALVELVRYLRGKYGELSVIGHRDVMATACPGKNFPWNELRKKLLEGAIKEVKKLDNTPDSYAKEAVDWAVKNEILFGNADGDYMLKANVTRQNMLVFLYRVFKLIIKTVKG